MKKAQTEIMGIAVIVIILVIGMFFMIAQRMKPRESNKSSFIDPKLAQSFLNSLMNTKTSQNVIVSDILKDCFSNRRDLCGSKKDCCLYAQETMKTALEYTLGSQNRAYRLTVSKKGAAELIPEISSGWETCEENEQPGFYYIPPPPPIVVKLEICK